MVAKLQPRFVTNAGVCVRRLGLSQIRFNGLAIFMLFFGVAAVEAFRTHDWIKAIFWLATGSGFIVVDSLRKRV